MARPHRIWFRPQTGWWMVQIGTKQIKLSPGKHQRKEAEQKFYELVSLRAEAPDAPTARVADIIECFLGWAKNHLATDTH